MPNETWNPDKVGAYTAYDTDYLATRVAAAGKTGFTLKTKSYRRHIYTYLLQYDNL